MYAELDSKEYQLYLDADDYMISGTDGKFILKESGKNKYKNAQGTSFSLEASDVARLTEVYEFADEQGKFTGISEDDSNELKYSQKYTDGEKTIYVVKKDENGITAYEYYYTASASDTPVAVTARLCGYNDGTKFYDFKNAGAVVKTVKEQQTAYTTHTVTGTELTVTAEVESLSSGVVVTPNKHR